MATVKGVWVFNDTIGTGTAIAEVEFSTNGVDCTMIEAECIVDMPGVYSATIYYDGIGTVYDNTDDPAWLDDNYKTVDFGTNAQKVSDDFYTWLTANAVQVTEEGTYPTVSGVWVFNETLVQSTFNCVWQDVKFTCNGVEYLSMVDDGSSTENYIGYSPATEENSNAYTEYLWAYTGGEWNDESYRTIDFGEAEQDVSNDFYSWLTANAVQQTVSSATFDLSTLNLPAGTYSITVKARADGYADSPESAAVSYVAAPVSNTYSITANLSGCSGYSTNPTEIDEGGSVTLYFMPNDGYALPVSVSVTGAEYDWYWSSGQLTLRNPTGAVYVSISCASAVSTYSISVITDDTCYGSSTNPTQIDSDETVQLQFYPMADGTSLESHTVIVEGANSQWDGTTGTLVLSNAASYVKVTIRANAADNLISFTINGTEYQAEEGMTFGTWCNSTYNTGGYQVCTGTIGGVACNDVHTSNGRRRVASKYDVIAAGTAYTHGAQFIHDVTDEPAPDLDPEL